MRRSHVTGWRGSSSSRALACCGAAALVATGAIALSRPGAGDGQVPRLTARGSSPVTEGYPYTARCPGAGIADVVDRWGMYECNCTSYVAWALVANRQRTDWFVPGAMDAWNWPNVARRGGLVVNTVPVPGAVAVWPRLAPPFGHVAYVTRVDRPGSVDVAEYNFPYLGAATYVFGTRDGVSTRGAVFIHVPRSPRPSPAALLR